jgi:hypothetical protein
MFSSLVVLAPALVSLSLGALYTDPSQLKLSYDFIVVGSELPTNPLTKRLDSWHCWKCCRLPSNRRPTHFRPGLRSGRFVSPHPPIPIPHRILISSESNEGVLASHTPFLAATLTPNTLYNWNYTTTAQAVAASHTPGGECWVAPAPLVCPHPPTHLCHCSSRLHPHKISWHTNTVPSRTSTATRPTPVTKAGTGTTSRNTSKRSAPLHHHLI